MFLLLEQLTNTLYDLMDHESFLNLRKLKNNRNEAGDVPFC